MREAPLHVLLQSRERPRPARAPLRAPPAAPTATVAGRDAAPARAPSPVPAELPASPIARFLSPRPLLGSAAQLVLGNLSSNSPSGGSPAAPAAPASGGTPPAAAPTPADGAAAAPPSGAAPPLAAPTASTAGGGAAVPFWKLLCSDVQGLSGSLQLVTHERRLTFTSAFHKRSLSFPLKHLNWWELPPGPSEGTARVRPPGGFQGSGRTGPGAPPGLRLQRHGDCTFHRQAPRLGRACGRHTRRGGRRRRFRARVRRQRAWRGSTRLALAVHA